MTGRGVRSVIIVILRAKPEESFEKIFKYLLTKHTMRCIVCCERGYLMDAQLKRGLLDICVLAALQAGDSYGYKIIKDVSPYIEISESTLYPILKRLEAGVCVTAYTVEHNSRLRKYYKITGVGLVRIEEFLEEWKQIMEIYHFIKGGGSDEQN